jgi:hypothetical protein
VATCVRVLDAELPKSNARPNDQVLEWITAFAVSTTRTARCLWTESQRVELRARCIDQKRRAEFATVDAQVAIGADDAAAAEFQLVDRARWNSVQPVYQASARELVLLGYYIGILLEEAEERGYSEMKANPATGAAGEQKLLGAAMNCIQVCLLDEPGEALVPEAAAGNALLEELEMPSTQLSQTDVGENLVHLHTLIKFFGLVRALHLYVPVFSRDSISAATTSVPC